MPAGMRVAGRVRGLRVDLGLRRGGLPVVVFRAGPVCPLGWLGRRRPLWLDRDGGDVVGESDVRDGVQGAVLEAGTRRVDGDRGTGGGGSGGDGRLADGDRARSSRAHLGGGRDGGHRFDGEDEGQDRREGASTAPRELHAPEHRRG